MMRRCAGLVLAIAVTALLSDTAFAQCAMCRRALQSPEGQQMIGAFRSGILFLLAAPFAVFATVATLAVRRFRSHQLTNPPTCRLSNCMIAVDDPPHGRAR